MEGPARKFLVYTLCLEIVIGEKGGKKDFFEERSGERQKKSKYQKGERDDR